MSHPVAALRKLLNPKKTSVGRVIKVENTAYIVATQAGTQIVQRYPGDSTDYAIGSEVAIQEGYIRKRNRSVNIYVV